ncbi:uncharacterized protein G2W53_037661 [Senna tora]|uniref:Uncharacterized protein n=1 Tax=Senna tora TaxID=362788 RepID=A0A834SN01_9FABA|nr:uncharacterized protein G2W53_037661 [Senna tora]
MPILDRVLGVHKQSNQNDNPVVCIKSQEVHAARATYQWGNGLKGKHICMCLAIRRKRHVSKKEGHARLVSETWLTGFLANVSYPEGPPHDLRLLAMCASPNGQSHWLAVTLLRPHILTYYKLQRRRQFGASYIA